MDRDAMWAAIEAHQGETFEQVRGGQFSYSVAGGCVQLDRTNQQIPRSHFETALSRWPVDGPASLQDLRGPSYIYALLADHRIQR